MQLAYKWCQRGLLYQFDTSLHVQQLDLLAGPKQPQVTSNWDKEELVNHLSDLCDSLLAEGFRWHDVQEALQARKECSPAALEVANMHPALRRAGSANGANE